MVGRDPRVLPQPWLKPPGLLLEPWDLGQRTVAKLLLQTTEGDPNVSNGSNHLSSQPVV